MSFEKCSSEFFRCIIFVESIGRNEMVKFQLDRTLFVRGNECFGHDFSKICDDLTFLNPKFLVNS